MCSEFCGLLSTYRATVSHRGTFMYTGPAKIFHWVTYHKGFPIRESLLKNTHTDTHNLLTYHLHEELRLSQHMPSRSVLQKTKTIKKIFSISLSDILELLSAGSGISLSLSLLGQSSFFLLTCWQSSPAAEAPHVNPARVWMAFAEFAPFLHEEISARQEHRFPKLMNG